jgi:hypothetical protein
MRMNEIDGSERADVIFTSVPFGAERGGPTETICYSELPLIEARKRYGKAASPPQCEQCAP